MKTLFFTCLTFAILLGCMGIFFGFVIYNIGTDIREINTTFLFILGMIVVIASATIILATPVTHTVFWLNLKEQNKVLKELYAEKERLIKARHKYEQNS